MLSGIITLMLTLIFLGVVAWAYGRERASDFEAAARLPLADAGEPRA